ncbi:uncharacterized protein EV154DRAFT_500723 [Mucor mucedo]|uniref:uncharacterized protein n=1 Tax=Mucor mucedo TaxID=29922 RepID=UPI00221E58F4|nr:uncharacterized protein EV154DRAFT_500723 [Mucor mucedo]KAI7893762.1 hypothetical protein EV154DRAFT_500723 [Mucor mucedo]
MVQPNIRIYPLAYLTEDSYSQWEEHIHDLAKKSKTDIKFNFVDQCFEIKGRSQQACDEASKRIITLLLPALNRVVDENKFAGTFEDLDSLSKSARPSPTNSTLRSSSSRTPPMVGRPLNPEEVDKKHAIKKGGATNENNEREAYFTYETESDEPEDSDEEFMETFTFAKNIQNPKEILTGPPSNNSKPPDYLRIIGNDTETECSLHGRDVKIVGTCQRSIKEAADRFRNLQTIFKRRKRPTNVVPCVHYPTESPRFGIYFCSLDRYAQQAYVATPALTSPVYVMLPVFKDKHGNEQKPKDLLPAVQNQPPPQWVSQQQHQQRQPDLSLDERMRLASLEHRKGYGNENAGMAPDQNTLWGENKPYVVRQSASKPVPSPKPTAAPVQKPPQEDFPSLMSTPRPPVKKPQQNTRRVMRVIPQKSARSPSANISNAEIIREYNLQNIKSSLQDGLEGVRGFKGDIKFGAKLGKVLWGNMTAETQKKIWDFHDIRDIVVKERGVVPLFNGVTTKSEDVINQMSDLLPEAYGRSAYFEMYADARNQPSVPYEPVVMYMSQGVVELKKIVTKTNKVTEIDWVSLDRKFDFQMLLKTEELTRTDVRPYNTFIKKVAVCPNTRLITFENVPDFLNVRSILLKQTTKYRIHFPFVVEITRVEKLPLVKQKLSSFGIDKIQGETGKGQVWYDLDVFYSAHDEIFKANNDLPVGKLASWSVQDIIGKEEDAAVAIVEYIRCLLTLVEMCEGAVA